jgi:hypothetical protein
MSTTPKLGFDGLCTTSSRRAANNKIRRYVISQREANPGKFLRDIDATTFGQLIDIVINPKLFTDRFGTPLAQAYQLRHEEAKHFLIRLREIRDAVSHGRGCSARQLEQAICYSNDLVDSLKIYFGQINMEKAYDVPSIFRFSDSLGNTSYLENDVNEKIVDRRQQGRGNLYPGETLVAEVEVDPSFQVSEYDVAWFAYGHERTSGSVARAAIQNRHVGQQFELWFEVTSKRDWHRLRDCDDRLILIYRVLPPVI